MKVNKKDSILMHKLVCLSMLLQETIDELKPDTPIMKKTAEDLTVFTELLLDSLKNTETIQKHTYFQEISNKIDTVMRKSFNPEM